MSKTNPNPQQMISIKKVRVIFHKINLNKIQIIIVCINKCRLKMHHREIKQKKLKCLRMESINLIFQKVKVSNL